MKLSAVIVLASFALVAFRCAVGQQTGKEIVIEVKAVCRSLPPRLTIRQRIPLICRWRNDPLPFPGPGCRLGVAGKRAERRPSISWETEPMPDVHGDFTQFIWLAGIECAGFTGEVESHNFAFLINGQRWFTFRNAKDDTAKNWKITGKDGSELTFNAAMTDRAGDLFGYMILKAPAKDFRPGNSLLLEVRGDNSGSPDWYMTFQHDFNFAPRYEPSPLCSGMPLARCNRCG